jgi:8-oxo-dGTP pyrophosphatase MutT (NUDIX family)
MSATTLLSDDEKLARLTGEARDRRWANVRPVDAATLIIIDRNGTEPRVLMGKRHPNHKFMPDKFVFPGGRMESQDARIPVESELRADVVAALLSRTPRATVQRARRLALAAIRETFEETGFVIGLPCQPRKAVPEGTWREFTGTGHLPDLQAIHFLARAITPPKRPKRFDTRFFVVDASAIRHNVGTRVGPEAELTELAWLTLRDTADLPLPAITRVILTDLDEQIRAGTIGHRHPIPFYFERQRKFQRELID